MLLDVPPRRSAAIGLTPLIDVVFILLLFFMLTTRFGQQQAIELRMPGEGGGASATASDAVTLRLGADGTVALPDGSRVPQPELATDPLVLQLVAEAVSVRLAVDDAADLQGLVSLLDRFDAMGLAEVTVQGLGR